MNMESWIVAFTVAFVVSLCDSSPPVEESKDIREEWMEDNGHIDGIARMLRIRYKEITGRTFKILTQSLETTRTVRKNVGFISIDSKTGEISLTQALDREELCRKAEECFIKITLMINRPNHTPDLVNLRLNIVDVNDNRPTFRQRKYDVIIAEGEYEEGDVIALNDLRASDADIGKNGEITYALNANPYFAIAENQDRPDALELRVLRTPDHETKPVHNLTLYAEDGGEPMMSSRTVLNITIADANDNAPVFTREEYIVKVDENITKSSRLVTVHASDRDSGKFGQVRYRVEPLSLKSTGGLVSVHRVSGEVRLEKKLDKAEHDSLRICIEAADSDPTRPLVGRTWIKLEIKDVNDHKPEIDINFLQYSFNNTDFVKESSPGNQVIAFISATDEDEGANGDVEIRVRTYGVRHSSPDEEEVFRVFTFQGGLLSSVGPLDREQYQKYVIRITACDRGIPLLCREDEIRLNVLDTNDDAPVFVGPRETLVVREDANVGVVVGRFQAEDKDAAYPPVFALKDGRIVESRNGVVRYAIAKGDRSYFSINPVSGDITLEKKLDHESLKHFELIVTATDGGSPPLSASINVPIQIYDVNDNRPVFTNPAKNGSSVQATILKDQPIMVVKARDLDKGRNARVRYRIVKEDDVHESDVKRHKGLFLLNPISGVLRLNFSKPNLTNHQGPHTLVIAARDSADYPLSTLIVMHVKVSDADIPYPPLSSAGFEAKFTIVVAALSAAALFLIVLIAVVFIRRRRRNRPHTYDCKMGKEVRQAWISLPNCSGPRDGEDDRQSSKSLEAIVRDRREDCESPSRGAALNESHKLENVHQLSLPVVRSVDMDSGRGESGSENDDTAQSDLGAHGHPHSRQTSKSSRRGSNHSDVASSRLSELGPRCDEDCRKFGHSDACWLPSPNEDYYRPPSGASHHSLQYATPPTSTQLLYRCDDPGHAQSPDSHGFIHARDRLQPTDYLQTTPSNWHRPADGNTNCYDVELETIAEGVPLGIQQNPDTYNIDDVCGLTNQRLSTMVDPRFISGNSGDATIRRMGKHVPELNSQNHWKRTRFNSVSSLTGPTHAYSYNDISRQNTACRPLTVTPARFQDITDRTIYPYASFSPFSPEQSSSPTGENVNLEQPLPLLQHTDGDSFRGAAYGHADDSRTGLLQEQGCCSPGFSSPGHLPGHLYL